MLHRSTIQLLRFPFSYFLMPVFWFALSFVETVNWRNAVLAFCILHLLVYPSSNGYNSYMDRDESSIGGVEKPLQPTRQLFITTIVLDVVSVLLSLLISPLFAGCILAYIIFSHLYSYRGIRLKQYPIAGYLTVILNQGALTFFMVMHAASALLLTRPNIAGMIAATFLIGGFYPITQVYQHASDRKDGVTTISILLGIKGTFIFCAIMYAIALAILFVYYNSVQQLNRFLVLQIFFVPVLAYFLSWVYKVWKDQGSADFKHTMKMNWLASTCTSLAFITIIILNYIG